LIANDADDPTFAAFRTAETIGRPLGTPEFIRGLERILGRPIARRAPGRKPSSSAAGQEELL
jgi:putative transposase